MSLKRLLYTLFLYLIFPLVFLRLLLRSRSNRDYRKRWSERLGFTPKHVKIINQKLNDKQTLWLHAVSVGEVIAAKPLINSLLDEFSNNVVIVTTTTPTGSDRVNDLFAKQIQDQTLIHVYFPYDLLGSISRFINTYKPKVLIVVETEIWPNLYAKCHQQSIPVVMVNARLSSKSVNSYLKIKSLVSETLSRVSVIAVRSKIDAERFASLGAQIAKIKEIGNIKYDLIVDKIQLQNADKYKQYLTKHSSKQSLVFVSASTHAGEDEKILTIYEELLKSYPELVLVLVPRHPERFEQVYLDSVEQLPKQLTVIKHSEFERNYISKDQKANVIIGDSMGEMQLWYSLADVVFIGGSLVKTGGHNPLEATIFGVPVFSGPHMFNFEDISKDLTAAELLFISDDESKLLEEISSYLSHLTDSNKQAFQGRADAFMQQHRGVTARLMDQISKNIS